VVLVGGRTNGWLGCGKCQISFVKMFYIYFPPVIALQYIKRALIYKLGSVVFVVDYHSRK
jgi:hypothetical protein